MTEKEENFLKPAALKQENKDRNLEERTKEAEETTDIERIQSLLDIVSNREKDTESRGKAMIDILRTGIIPEQCKKDLFNGLRSVVEDKKEDPGVRIESLRYFLRQVLTPENAHAKEKKEAYGFISNLINDQEENSNIRETIAQDFSLISRALLSEKQEENKQILDFIIFRINQKRDSPRIRVAFLRALKESMDWRLVSLPPEVKEGFIDDVKERLIDKNEDLLLRKEGVFTLYKIFEDTGISQTNKEKIWSLLKEVFEDRSENSDFRKEPAEVFEYILQREKEEYLNKSFSVLYNCLSSKEEDPALRAHVAWVLKLVGERCRDENFREKVKNALNEIKRSPDYKTLLQHVATSKYSGEKRLF